MNPKNQKGKPSINSKDGDWVNYTVDIHDGWADDVALVYPEGGWKPDEGELTNLNLETPDADSGHSGKISASKKSSDGEDTRTAAEIIRQSQTSVRRKTHYFRTFLILWLGLLSIVIAFALGYFYDFLDAYENAYQSSRPYHTMDSVMQSFYDMDMDTVYKMQTDLPAITEFETEDTVKLYMAELLEGKALSYEKTAYYNEDFPEYQILADGYVVATIALRKSQTDRLEYDFPVWYVSAFTFYTQPLENFYIEVPENFTVYVNGIKLGDDYYVRRTSPAENMFVEPYQTLPDIKTYQGDGLYAVPTVTAVNSFGTEYIVLPEETTGSYLIPYPADCPDADAMKAYAAEVVSTYANFVSDDTPDNALDQYFPQDSALLPLIKANTSRQYFTSHQTPVIQNIEIREFIAYNEDVYYCEVFLEQSMVISSWRDPEIVPTDGRFYFVKIDGEWKVSAIAY